MRVIDGMHRLSAAARKGREQVEVIYFDGSQEDAFILAVELNVKHGSPLSLRDRKAAARRILETHADLSDRAISAKVGLSGKTVAAMRVRSGAETPQPDSRRGRDGRLYPVDRIKKRQLALKLITEQPGASLREVASAAGVSPATVAAVRDELAASQDPVDPVAPARQSRRTRSGDKRDNNKQAVLTQLCADPSLRSKEAGRDLLRWLADHAIDGADMPSCMDVIPPYRLALVSALARQAASAWLEFADRLDATQKQIGVP